MEDVQGTYLIIHILFWQSPPKFLSRTLRCFAACFSSTHNPGSQWLLSSLIKVTNILSKINTSPTLKSVLAAPCYFVLTCTFHTNAPLVYMSGTTFCFVFSFFRPLPSANLPETQHNQQCWPPWSQSEDARIMGDPACTRSHTVCPFQD